MTSGINLLDVYSAASGIAHDTATHEAGIVAVEAAVRADQIAKDAALADRHDFGARLLPEKPEPDARARAIAATIRAQLTP